MTLKSNEITYHRSKRGERLKPSRFHPRYQLLTLLAAKLRAIVESESLPPGETILDYGCANKPYQPLFLTKFTHYIGADLPGNYEADVTTGPQGELPVPNESVDCVASTQVLEHVANPSAYLGEARRVLKPGGRLILSTHGCWPYHPDPTDYWRWTLDGLKLEIHRAGFEIVSIQGIFGITSVALQLWQDATDWPLPKGVRQVYVRFLQSVIGLIECKRTARLSVDAAIYIVLARRAEDGHP